MQVDVARAASGCAGAGVGSTGDVDGDGGGTGEMVGGGGGGGGRVGGDFTFHWRSDEVVNVNGKETGGAQARRGLTVLREVVYPTCTGTPRREQ